MLELYHTVIRLIARDGVSRVLMGLSKKFAKTNEEAVLLQNNINKIKSTMLAGAGMAFMGGLGLFATAKMLKPAAAYLHTLNQANAVGMKHVEVANLVKAAWETTAKVQTVSAREALGMGITLRRILGSAPLATSLLPEVAKFKSAYIIAKESGRLGSASDPEQMVYTAAKAAEMAGMTGSRKQFTSFMENMMRVSVGTAGKVTPMMYMGLLKYARGAGLSLSMDTLFNTMPIFMEEFKVGKGGSGGARGGPGSLINAWYRMMVQGIMTKNTKTGFGSLGLLTGGKNLSSADLAKYKTMYKTMLMHPATIGKGMETDVMGLPLVGGKMAATDPVKWIFNYLEPALRKKYPSLNRRDLAAKASLYFKGNSLAGYIATNAIAREWQINKERRMRQAVPGVDSIISMGKKSDPYTSYAAVSAQWNNVMVSMGLSSMKILLPYLTEFAQKLNKLSMWFQDNQKLASKLVITFGALSAAMMFGGVVLLLRGALLGLGVAFKLLFSTIVFGEMATGIGEIALALLALYEVIKHWKTLYPAWKKRSKAFKWDEGLFHPFGQHNALDHSATANKLGIHIRPHTEHRAETHVLMDGKKVGKIVSKHIGNDLSKSAINQKSNFDIGLSLPTPNYNF